MHIRRRQPAGFRNGASDGAFDHRKRARALTLILGACCFSPSPFVQIYQRVRIFRATPVGYVRDRRWRNRNVKAHQSFELLPRARVYRVLESRDAVMKRHEILESHTRRIISIGRRRMGYRSGYESANLHAFLE
jgi:hypothetical protein